MKRLYIINHIMKKIALFTCFAAVMLFTGCVKDMPSPKPGDDADKVVELQVPASFDWTTTKSVACNFTASHPSRVFVASERNAEPFAEFMVGGGADAVALDLPSSARTLYVSYETETGMSAQEAVPVNDRAASFALSAKGKDYTGIEDGDKNSTEGNVIYMPARKNGWGTLLFEDLWPSYGDFDFNDFVVNYKVQLYMNNKNKVYAMLIGIRVKAVGGSLPYDLCLAMKGVKGGEIDEIMPYSGNAPEAALVALNSANNVKDPAVLKFLNVRNNSNRPSGAAYINTEPGYEMAQDQLVEASFQVYFRNSIALEDVAFDMFDFFLSRERESDGRSVEIHLGGFDPTPAAEADYNALVAASSSANKAKGWYYSNDGLVWALNVPLDIQHAYEKVDFLKAYPRLAEWAQSGGTRAQDWYLHGVEENLVKRK